MKISVCCLVVVSVCVRVPLVGSLCEAQAAVALPAGVRAVWDLGKAYRETTPTRERICLNGLWEWQPTDPKSEAVPEGDWGYFKVPGCWPGITDYMQKDFQTVYPNPSWQTAKLGEVAAAWYQREITIPADWTGRRLAVSAEYVNSYAAVYVDGRKIGEIPFPDGEVDLTAACPPGSKRTLSLLTVALPLKGVMLSYNDTNSAREVRGAVDRRGLCGDVFLVSTPAGGRLGEVTVNTSVRKWELTLGAGMTGLAPAGRYSLRAEITDNGRRVKDFTSKAFSAADVKDGRFTFTEKWQPDKLWDIHTPQNQYDVVVSLMEADGKVLDTGAPHRFGFREFWINGRDFHLNGTRLFLSAVPLDNAQVGAAPSSYAGAKESLLRLKSFGINFVYTHNYGCEPGAHLSFAEILRAADDVGMLVALSQPHFSAYDWKAPDADSNNGYARHAAFYVRVAQNHPAVVAYSTSHNATGYSEDMNPDMIDGIQDPRNEWSLRNTQLALRAEAIIRRLDPNRIVYHHSSGNLSSMHTVNFYPNFVPLQELDDWFEHWATEGVKPVFLVEYGAPFGWDWTMYRGWYKGARTFGSAVIPWDYCLAEWNAQFLGDSAYQLSDLEKRNLRWEAEQYRTGTLWHRWDYPTPVGERTLDEMQPVQEAYTTDNWRAFRTWGLSANSPWEHHRFWKLRDGIDKTRKELKVDWDNLQRPGFSPDYLDQQYERMDLAFERTDWIPTPTAKSLTRNNMPLLSYLAGKPGAFTSKDHLFTPGETVEKQLIVINNSRETITSDCAWSFGLPQAVTGSKEVAVATGDQARIPLRVDLPADLKPGTYALNATCKFSTGETQEDAFTVNVLAPAKPEIQSPKSGIRLALFDPKGETGKLLTAMGVRFQLVASDADLSGYDALLIGKAALTANGAAPDLGRVRDGLRVLVFEQTAEGLEKRLGFRIAEYGLRNVFRRVPDHRALAGLDTEALRDWRGAATLLPPRLAYEQSDTFSGSPVVRWCGLEAPRLWRCGNRGNVASVLLEKPARGDFLPLLDGGFGLQYSPLLEYREGKGKVLFCQLDVTGRTEADPAATRLVGNLLSYVADLSDKSDSRPTAQRTVVYIGEPAGKRHLDRAGIKAAAYDGGALSADQVLVVGRGGGQALKSHKTDIANWLKAGGHVLSLGLGADEANSFLPAGVTTTDREHIGTQFGPFGVGSAFAGVGPAEVHNRDPRELPLVTGGATALGDGVLAQAGNVVFCQVAPASFVTAPEDTPGLSANGDDAAEGKQSALVTMGTVPWAQVGQKVEAGHAGKTYTFSVLAKGVGSPVTARLEVERAGRPWDRAIRGEDSQLPADKWTDLHVTFQVEVDKPYPEGWQAYLNVGQPDVRVRADLFRLYEGQYVAARHIAGGAAVPVGRNLFANASFETGTDPWFFNARAEQQNLRKTYRRTAFLLTRLLANMGVRGETPLLSRFATPATGTPKESVVKNGGFGLDADNDGMPDGWQFSSNTKQATCAMVEVTPGAAERCLQLGCPAVGGGEKPGLMLSQPDVPVEEGQWYVQSFKAKAEELGGSQVLLALQDTTTWRALIDYQRFAPTEAWKDFSFLVRANGTAPSKTRFQIWHDRTGTLWLADLRMAPCDPPSEGRWSSGLYLDKVQDWDDPYRFFRW
ncbi:MAG: hypothetical protein COZ06_18395 [Armatimonadetes bacterium CG_4_10_14_3_um_filter_66_18]|nr:hypothetical protein [Armatimonadota bacterium]NCP32654.1 hypothetical protein [Armatimonadota bacterium]OIO91660.1 MAG: hypothetical protein AUJ96_33535 [Armatimonadetes bacterium CG2_30_66_41]PIY46563.1 MAG: hypothetical protein COZ06_18395 [Armatimonadetes bacterium CG_4_10_14_3_um_filter_66_18]